MEAVHLRPLRKLALKKAEHWMLERLEMTDGLGAIYPAMLNAIVALRCLGYSEDDPQLIRARDEFEKLGIEEPANEAMPEPTFRMTPCASPVWDTAQAVFALGEAGVPGDDPRMIKAADWMLAKEVRHKGDWAVKVKNTEPGGWYFEYNNEFYPDTDDTAQVLLALGKVWFESSRGACVFDRKERALCADEPHLFCGEDCPSAGPETRVRARPRCVRPGSSRLPPADLRDPHDALRPSPRYIGL